MTSTEQKIFEIIRRNRDKTARVQYISRYSGMSSAYVNLVCQGLCRRGELNFSRGLAVIPALADVPVAASSVPIEEGEILKDQEAQDGGFPVAEAEPIAQETTYAETASPISSFGNLQEDTIVALANAGYRTVGDVAEVPIAKLMSLGGMNVKQAADLINQARKGLGMLDGEK